MRELKKCRGEIRTKELASREVWIKEQIGRWTKELEVVEKKKKKKDSDGD
jgi:hypothetical protein